MYDVVILTDHRYENPKKIDYAKLSVSQLGKAISIAVKNEDYELAAYLRDEINKRK